jgi:hypothetical protein
MFMDENVEENKMDEFFTKSWQQTLLLRKNEQ